MSDNQDIKTLQAVAERLAERNTRLRAFLLRLTDPEDLGHAVSHEVRKLASALAANQNTPKAL